MMNKVIDIVKKSLDTGDTMKKIKEGLTAEEVKALKFGLELHEKSVKYTNSMTESMIDTLIKKNEILTEENEHLKYQLYPLLDGLDLIQSVMERRYNKNYDER